MEKFFIHTCLEGREKLVSVRFESTSDTAYEKAVELATEKDGPGTLEFQGRIMA